jgi:hypothetical protein
VTSHFVPDNNKQGNERNNYTNPKITAYSLIVGRQNQQKANTL